MTTILSSREELAVPQLARWAKISEDDARAHVVMVKDAVIEARERTGYSSSDLNIGPATWGKSREELVAEFVTKARKGNGRRGANALRAKYGETAANAIITKAKAGR